MKRNNGKSVAMSNQKDAFVTIPEASNDNTYPRDPGARIPHDRATEILARTIYGEARGESVRGKEAIAAVIMNRVNLANRKGGYWWGRTIEDVCGKPWQFSCWNDNDPNRKKIEKVGPENRVFRSCIRIARRAAAGTLEDPTRGATHYHTFSSRPPWARGHAPVCVIGRHVFYAGIE